jgi:hypothetical protein
MSAKEMFEKIGDYFENETRITIEFYNKNTDDYDYVEFWKETKYLDINIDQLNFKLYKYDLKMLFEAINKQLEELGWNKC